VSTYESIAPGRVNLIGEHIDYAGLSVLPMAVDRDIRIRFRVLDEPSVRLSSSISEFEDREFSLLGPAEVVPGGDWSNYARAAAEGLRHAGCSLAMGFEGVVTGSIPVASGMSSSSALVVASAQALLCANDLTMGPLALAELMAAAEHFVGVAGGGMDQAASLNGRKGHAIRVDFDPLRVEAIPMPEDWGWFVASSMVRAEKSTDVKQTYNQRTIDCGRALQAVWDAAGAAAGPHGRDSCRTYKSLLAVDHSTDELSSEAGLLRAASEVLDPVLERRFRHIVTEAGRVAAAEMALRSGDPGEFGRLMVASHESLRFDCEVSIPELDELVALAMENGAHGARLTGAGFGGCVVVLCPIPAMKSIMESMTQVFFKPRGVLGDKGPLLSQVLFPVKPSTGARIVEV